MDQLGTRTLLCFEHECSGYRTHSEHERYCGLGMNALVIVCSGNTNGIIAWAWMLWLSDALGIRTLLWFTRGCSGYGMHSEHERFYGLGMDALVIGCTENANVILLLGMDALVLGCTGNTNVIVVYAWMLWLSHALGTRTLLWFGHECSGYRMLWEHEWYYGLGMDALVIGCTGNTNVIVVYAWMLWLSDALGTRKLLWFGQKVSWALGVLGQHYATTPIPPQPPKAKLRNPAKQGTEIPPLAKTSAKDHLPEHGHPCPGPCALRWPSPGTGGRPKEGAQVGPVLL